MASDKRNDMSSLAKQCDEWVRTGRGDLVEKAFAELTLSKIPRTERVVLAAIARRTGLIADGMKLLAQLDSKAVPASLLFRAFGHFAQWEYTEARPLLEAYVASSSLTPYQKIVGQVNLASVYVYLREWEKGSELLKEIHA